jgi:DNA-binding Lrp family transcriptional regulator
MVDNLTKQLLLSLRINGRVKLSEIHRSTKIPVTTIFERIKKFGKYVEKYVTLIDWQKIGFGIRIIMAVSINRNRKKNLQEFLLEHKNVNSVSRVNNNFDFILEAMFASIKELDAFNDELRSLKAKTKMFFVVEPVREEFFFTEIEHLDLF